MRLRVEYIVLFYEALQPKSDVNLYGILSASHPKKSRTIMLQFSNRIFNVIQR